MSLFWRRGSPAGGPIFCVGGNQFPQKSDAASNIFVEGDSPRAFLAMGLGVATFAAAAMSLGPSLHDVLAQEQDPRAVYMNIMRQDRVQPRVVDRANVTPAETSLRSLFGIGAGARASLPQGVRAYAPTPSLFPPASARRNAPVARLRSAAMSPLPGLDLSGGGLSRRSVCVRLCDGFAFPVADYSGEADNDAHSAVCAGLCPGAPTRLYVTTGESDRLTDSVSVKDHRPYSALPVAFRYVNSRDDSCACHAPGESLSKNVSLLHDFTLRAGDRVMTTAGFRIYQGAAAWTHRANQFAPLSRAGLGRSEYRLLAAIERASKLRGGAASIVASATAPTTSIPTAATKGSARASRALGPQVYLEENNRRIDALP